MRRSDDWLDDLAGHACWLNDAQRAGVSEPNAMVLATDGNR